MEYKLKLSNLSLNEQERELIDTRMSLGLARFSNLITNFDIKLGLHDETETHLPVICEVNIELHGGQEINIFDSAHDINAALTQTIQRTKRSIERHLKHHSHSRLGASSISRI